ncbi:Hypothetical_protein [Hexamita inflata]|uniref:Hypothetical_protein n=1 Tax=Hexamita inflata TaxID=28002 RepID=A0AA86PN12_9EUKA|nr:Hypothetical protein HINF_LOCUS27818 [Hexamita inflata]
MFDYDLEQLNLVMQQIDMIQYNRLEYKLTGAILTEYGMQQLSIVQNTPQFNQSVKSIVFSCSNMQGAQQDTCFQLLANDYGAAYSVPTYNLYFSFYQNDQLQQVLKAENCQARYTCARTYNMTIEVNLLQILLAYYIMKILLQQFFTPNLQRFQKLENIFDLVQVNKFSAKYPFIICLNRLKILLMIQVLAHLALSQIEASYFHLFENKQKT